MNSFPLRRAPSGADLPLRALATHLGAPDPGGGAGTVRGIAPLAQAGATELGFLAHRRYLPDLAGSRAGALLVAESLVPLLGEDARLRLVVQDPHRALASLLDLFFPPTEEDPEVHATAVLGRGVRLGEGARIGPYAVVEEGVSLGDRVRVGAHVVVGAGSRVGAGSILHPHAVLYPGTVLGAGVILHAGACLGVDGFGYVEDGGALRKVPQVGGCFVGDEVEIGANTTVDRGSIGETRVEAGAKLDNLVHLGHNVVVGHMTLLAAQVGVAGSTRIGAGVMTGGQVGINGHTHVGDGARLAGQAGVTGDVPAGATVMGFPARERGAYLRTAALQGKLPELRERIRKLEARLDELEDDRG